MLYLIWTLVIFVIITLHFRRIYSRFSKKGVKHLPPVPLLGNMYRLVFGLDHFTDEIVRTYSTFPNERFVGKYEFMKPAVVLRDLDLIKSITMKNIDSFIDHRSPIDVESEPMIGNSLFTMTGQKWKQMRSTLSPAFTSSKIRSMIPFMIESGEEMIHFLKKQLQHSEREALDVDCRDLASRYTNDVIASCGFGVKVNSHTDKEHEFFKMGKAACTITFYQMLKSFGYTLCPKLMKMSKISIFPKSTKDFFENLAATTMKHREMNNITRNDMINLLMEAKKGKLKHDVNSNNDVSVGFATAEESEVGKSKVTRAWTEMEIIAQTFLFFLAGFETVASVMTFMMFELALNPEIQNRLYEEIRECHANSDGQFDINTIQHLKYLDMVVSETLRLWPPILSTDRKCLKTFNLGKPNDAATEDYFIHKDEGIIIPIWAIHRSEEYFPNPKKFDPERFSEENQHNIIPFSFMPFGLGPRNCIGSRFALSEVKAAMYQLLLNFEITPSEKTCLPIQLSRDTMNISFKGGHWLKFKARIT